MTTLHLWIIYITNLLLVWYDETLAKLRSEEHERLFSRIPETEIIFLQIIWWRSKPEVDTVAGGDPQQTFSGHPSLSPTFNDVTRWWWWWWHLPLPLTSTFLPSSTFPPSTTSPDTLLSLSPPWTLPETLRSLTEEATSKLPPPEILRSRAISLSSWWLSRLLGPLSPLKPILKNICFLGHLDIVLQLSEMSLVSWVDTQGILLNIWLNVFFSACNKIKLDPEIHPWSFLYINQSKYLSRQALLFPTWAWQRSYSIKANKLACHQPASLVCLVCCQPISPSYLTVWFVLFVVNQFHRHIWLLDLSCLLATNFTVIFGCLVCLVCYQPISPNYHHYFQKR